MKIEDWGLIEYPASCDRQMATLDQVADGQEECLVLCTHPPVVTLGRATDAEDLQGWMGATYESTRGGRATYHGPNQIVIYPILDLRQRGRDVHAYLRALERATVNGLGQLGLDGAQVRATQVGGISLTGVWIGEKKIASIGIAVRKWITYHGVAINIWRDPKAFNGIRPCGFSPGVMTSLEEELGHAIDAARAKGAFTAALLKEFTISYQL